MESRGDTADATSTRRRLAIPRRSSIRPRHDICNGSADDVLSEQIGCDRGSPCSTCISAKLTCTFGTVASSKTTTSKQRVLISAQYEQKIDEIADGLEAIKVLLQDSQPLPQRGERDGAPSRHKDAPFTLEPLTIRISGGSISKEPAKWDHSAQLTNFVKTIVEDRASQVDTGTEENDDILPSLKRLAKALDEPNTARDLSFPEIRNLKPQDPLSMPPVEVAVLALRWAKEHKAFFRIDSIGRVLPLDRFTEICQKVYFAVDEYSQLDFILANGYLSYIIPEYIVATDNYAYHEYYVRYRQNAQMALSRLPLLLPATIDSVAVLAFGTSYAIESSKATLAWTYISNAANLCQTLGYHHIVDGSQEAQFNLFWMVFLLEKSLSLRLGRSSNFRDAEFTTPLPSNIYMRRCAQTASMQGKIYDQLYSPSGLARFDVERGLSAQMLASEFREIISDTKIACYNPINPPGAEEDKMRAVYLKVELVKQLAILTLILRAIPTPVGSPSTITDECAMAAHETLDMHQQAVAAIEDSKDRFMTHRYLHWGILHTPFVPFSVLFTRIVQLSDGADLSYLDRFSESLQHGEPATESITHPYRLYNLLCQAARLYIKQNPPAPLDGATDMGVVDPWSVFDFAAFGNEASAGAENSDLSQPLSHGLSHWFYGNQQLMGLLDDDVMF
ncbi:fungal-specific transcription factor domain-containing protein [Xylaria cf. heliscus]|nr:fungal-specific transcription factor domain-containing protein [Xylaria cf. heliscus]